MKRLSIFLLLAGAFFLLTLPSCENHPTAIEPPPESHFIETPPFETLAPTSQLDVGLFHTCAVGADGGIDCWGSDQSGQASSPTGTFTQVSAGSGHTCAIHADGEIECWGLDYYGQANR